MLLSASNENWKFSFHFMQSVIHVILKPYSLYAISNKARIFLLVDLWNYFSDLGSRDEKKIWKWPVDWSFSDFFKFKYLQNKQ